MAGQWPASRLRGAVIGSGLMIGAWEGNMPMMDLFHSRGADINKANHLGEQALAARRVARQAGGSALAGRAWRSHQPRGPGMVGDALRRVRRPCGRRCVPAGARRRRQCLVDQRLHAPDDGGAGRASDAIARNLAGCRGAGATSSMSRARMRCIGRCVTTTCRSLARLAARSALASRYARPATSLGAGTTLAGRA
jgi:hypothetical protein